jgi:hypothetical protein
MIHPKVAFASSPHIAAATTMVMATMVLRKAMVSFLDWPGWPILKKRKFPGISPQEQPSLLGFPPFSHALHHFR